MKKLPKLFIKGSLVFLALSAILGVLITIGPGYSFMHSHLALIGWVSFMIFGLCYEIIPRSCSRSIYSEKLGIAQFWLGTIGLIGLTVSYAFMTMYEIKGRDILGAKDLVLFFGVIETASIFMFIYNIWKTISNEK
jgi:hypothetical protein